MKGKALCRKSAPSGCTVSGNPHVEDYYIPSERRHVCRQTTEYMIGGNFDYQKDMFICADSRQQGYGPNAIQQVTWVEVVGLD